MSSSDQKPKKDIHAGKDPKEKEKKRLAIKDRKFEHKDVAKEGQVSVPRRFGRWNKRWMIAKNDGQVFFFKSSNCKQMTSDYFDLKEVGLIKTLKKEKGHDFAFKVKLSDGEIWIGAAESEEERRSWITTLQTLRDKAKGKKPFFATNSSSSIAYQQQQYAQYYQQQQYAQYYQQYYAQGSNTPTTATPTPSSTSTAAATPIATATATSVAVRDAPKSPSSPATAAAAITTTPTAPTTPSTTQDPAAQLQQMQMQMQNLQQYQQYLQYQQYAQQYPQQYAQQYAMYAQQYPQYAQQYSAQQQQQQSYPYPSK